MLAVRRICSCSAGGVASIRRTIEAVRARTCARSAARSATRRSSSKITRLTAWRDDQGEQQQRDQLAGEAARPERRAGAAARRLIVRFDVGGEHVAAAPHAS